MEEQTKAQTSADEVNEMMRNISLPPPPPNESYVYEPGNSRLTSIASVMILTLDKIRGIQDEMNRQLYIFLDKEERGLEPLSLMEHSPASINDFDNIVMALNLIEEDQKNILNLISQSIG